MERIRLSRACSLALFFITITIADAQVFGNAPDPIPKTVKTTFTLAASPVGIPFLFNATRASGVFFHNDTLDFEPADPGDGNNRPSQEDIDDALLHGSQWQWDPQTKAVLWSGSKAANATQFLYVDPTGKWGIQQSDLATFTPAANSTASFSLNVVPDPNPTAKKNATILQLLPDDVTTGTVMCPVKGKTQAGDEFYYVYSAVANVFEGCRGAWFQVVVTENSRR